MKNFFKFNILCAIFGEYSLKIKHPAILLIYPFHIFYYLIYKSYLKKYIIFIINLTINFHSVTFTHMNSYSLLEARYFDKFKFLVENKPRFHGHVDQMYYINHRHTHQFDQSSSFVI